MVMPSFYFALSDEVSALGRRLDTLLGPSARGALGSPYAASAFRKHLRKLLPASIAIGKGHICGEGFASPLYEVILYDKNASLLYEEGDLIFAPAASVRAWIDVRGHISPDEIQGLLDNLALTAYEVSGAQATATFAGLLSWQNAPELLAGASLPQMPASSQLYVAAGEQCYLCPGLGSEEEGLSGIPAFFRSLVRFLSPGSEEGEGEVSLPEAAAPAELARPAKALRPAERRRRPADLPDGEGMYPLHHAALRRETAKIASLVAEGAHPDCKNREGDTPLHLACRLGDLRSAEALLDAEADPNARNYVYASPLHLAAELNLPELAELLVARGAELEARNNRGQTPLHKAALSGNCEAAEALIRSGADLHACMEKDMLPLHLAAWYGQSDMIRLLLAQGARINQANSDGNTPLHFAAFNGQVKAIKLLINHQADMTLRNALGVTYLDGLNGGYQGEMIRVLE
jgi:ankyrin repeat protein